MRTSSYALAEYIEMRLAQNKDTVTNMCNHIGITPSAISMWKKQETDPRLGLILKITSYLGISIGQLLDIPMGDGDEKLPDDIANMVYMLKFIDTSARKMIRLNIKNYYEEALGKKESVSYSVG